VFIMSNDPAGNEVIAFDVGRSGSLSPAGTYETGGTGLGAGLGSQGSLVTSEDGRYLLAVNAGSDEVSVFRIAQHGLFLVDTDPSGGQTPTSVAIHRNLVYVLNNGDDTISGYRLGWRGLTPIGGSTRSLSQPADAGQVSFTPDGNRLVVTQKDTNTVDVFNVDRSGRTSAPVANPSTGATPFGFAFDKYEHLVVSNAGGGVVNGSSVTSYRISSSGELHVLDGPAPTDQSAACWVIISPDGQYAYTTNAGSNTVSGFKVDRDGDLVRLDADGVTATTGQGPIDGAFSDRTGYLFVLTGGADAIDGFRMTRDGGLAPVSQLGGLPAQSVGLAAT
jgi:6-phosphogluconolactonase (cycloisomerase 2 family)